jgi:adenylate cyclase
MDERAERDKLAEDRWRTYLTTGESERERRQRHLFRLLPGTPRCKNCYAPFAGPGSIVVRLFYGKQPSKLNPRLCNICEQFAREYQGGAEIELSLLFADVRGSTKLAEGMSPLGYSKLINRFYNTATEILIRSDALIDKIVGDQVVAMFVPGFAGPRHAHRALGQPKRSCAQPGTPALKGPGSHWVRGCIQASRLLGQSELKAARRISRCSATRRIRRPAWLPPPDRARC